MELLLEGGETRRMGVGDKMVQRGTTHAWRNLRTDVWARTYLVLFSCYPVEMSGEVWWKTRENCSLVEWIKMKSMGSLEAYIIVWFNINRVCIDVYRRTNQLSCMYDRMRHPV